MAKPEWPTRWARSGASGYAVAILSVATALIAYRLFPKVLAASATPPFLAAVMLSAWFGGVGPAMLAVALTTLTVEWFRLPSFYSVGLTIEDVPRILMFVFSALSIAWLTGKQQRANEMLQAEIAEHQRAEEALQKTQADLARVTRITTMGELTASIAHEINQPLAAVVTNGSACLRWLAGETPNLEKARSAVVRIISDGHRASNVIAQVRALMGKAPAKKARVNVNDLVLDTIPLARREIAINHAAARTELAADLPAVMGDRVQLQQVLLNLIMNGLEAMSAVKDRPRELLVRSRRPDDLNGVQIEVRDCGVGLDPRNLERLFDAFFTTKPEGMGMGLSISRTIIAAHGGRMWAAPNPDYGATFSFTVPADSESS